MKILSLLIILPALLTGLSCSKKNTVDEDKLIKVYADLLIIQDTTNIENYSLDSLRTTVLNRYDLTLPQYEEMIKVYNQEPKKWEEFFDKAIAYVNELKAKNKN